jgi:hypothetical protein
MYVIIPIRFSVVICNLLIDFPSYTIHYSIELIAFSSECTLSTRIVILI